MLNTEGQVKQHGWGMMLWWQYYKHWIGFVHTIGFHYPTIFQLILAANNFSKWGKRFEVQNHVAIQFYVQGATFK